MSIQQLRAMPSQRLRNFLILRNESAFRIWLAAAAPARLSGLVVCDLGRVGNERPRPQGPAGRGLTRGQRRLGAAPIKPIQSAGKVLFVGRHCNDFVGGARLPPGAKKSPAWRTQLPGEPAHGIGFHRIHGKGHFLDALAAAALERPLLDALCKGSDARQSHPVLAGRTHRSLSNEKTSHPSSQSATIGAAESSGLFDSRHSDGILSRHAHLLCAAAVGPPVTVYSSP